MESVNKYLLDIKCQGGTERCWKAIEDGLQRLLWKEKTKRKSRKYGINIRKYFNSILLWIF